MSLGLAFWILMLIWVVVNGALIYRGGWEASASMIPFILLLLLGWAVFGAPIKG